MSTLENKYVRAFIFIIGFILFCLFVMPIISILTEILFKMGNIVGSYVRYFTY